jgi:N utilization substance protein B
VGARTKARKRALDILFEADQRGSNANTILDARILDSGRETPLPAYSIELVRGVVSRWVEINAIIQDASPQWTIARMPGVDRALLRISTWEILCNDAVPVSVAIDEAVTLAKKLSTEDSASFINGLLSTIAKDAPALTHGQGSADGGESESVGDHLSDDDDHDHDDDHDDDDVVSWGPDAWDDINSTATTSTRAGDASNAESERAVGGAAKDGVDGDADDDADEPEADADFPDSGISDEVAQAWAEGLLGSGAQVVAMPDAESEATPDGDSPTVPSDDKTAEASDGKSSTASDDKPAIPSEDNPAAASGDKPATSSDSKPVTASEDDRDSAPEPTHLQD